MARLFFGASILIGALLSRDSRAGATVDLLFVGRNGGAIAPTDSVFVAPGDTLTMAVLLRNDEPLTLAWFSLGYDDGDDEFDVVVAFQWRGLSLGEAGTAFFSPDPLLFETAYDEVGPFKGTAVPFSAGQALPPSGGAFAGGYQMGTVVWKVKPGVNDDGADIGFVLAYFLGAAFANIDASVDLNPGAVIPEPGTASLVAVGLGLVLLYRRRGRGAGA